MQVNEEVILFFFVLKWLAASGFILFIHYVIEQSNHYQHVFYLLPLSFFAANLLSQFVLKQHIGTDALIAAIYKNYGKIQGSFVPTKIVNVSLILATGGSAGKESPCAQIGAGLGSVCANLLQVDDVGRRKMVLCGFCPGFACVFGAPIAGALFGIEVLTVGVILYEVLLPAFVASLTAYQISSALGVSFFYYPLRFVPAFGQDFFLQLLGGGILFGLCAYGLIRAIQASTALTNAIPIWRPWKGLLGGLLLVGLTLLFSRNYLGLGLDLMENCIKGHPVASYTFLLKALFTIITLSISRSGSVITPVLFIGATAGSFYADIVGADCSTFAAIGFVSLLSGAANTPIACSILAIELFGATVAPYAAVACVINFLMSGHRSLYASQVLGTPKSRAIQDYVGKELKDLNAHPSDVDIQLPTWLRFLKNVRRKH
ncbi:MAG: chloride channel protein [Stigonema ocellatum SAG 48.90 = DSM 106950]|uniref:chloride channel protein n=1 Tax=Spirosoma sp. TaxID=1899569 RepID=UPI002630B4F1|nr:chloride channel protein [Spirosoma sp.]MBR8837125.1 chloride channel protein [Stigonema ocellatum SAG 48.90 = DSM 106950]MCX6213860.1 chloride channel protein [Spirosoma sp.]